MKLTADDKIEIQELVARYHKAIDSRSPEEWAETFTETGVFESMRVGTHRGRAELLRFAQEFWDGDECAPWRGGQHWVANMIIEGDRRRARMFCYHMMFMPRSADAVESVIMAAYDDDVELVDGRWRFACKRVKPWPPPETGIGPRP